MSGAVPPVAPPTASPGRREASRPGPGRAALDVSRGVVLATARLAVGEVPGVARIGRGGSLVRRLLPGGPPVRIESGEAGLEIRVLVVARAGQSLGTLGRSVATAVRGAIERILGLEVARVTVVVDGVG
ncbi:MAG TPA: Asp23/Gls24 family envelope stress response protein [Candidatus Binatia bacterium]|nr:Asp23/Gls24 family envelope stress response protein [Candidatus Binatia bacterium]